MLTQGLQKGGEVASRFPADQRFVNLRSTGNRVRCGLGFHRARGGHGMAQPVVDHYMPAEVVTEVSVDALPRFGWRVLALARFAVFFAWPQGRGGRRLMPPGAARRRRLVEADIAKWNWNRHRGP